MYIKSIVLDGFKSYGNRVEVNGFDPEFNAITGLNGTGKSNILDSICFVLGITNLSNVRAGSLQELIYKHGQAGITKATVSITFDNRDKRQCPIGYENHDEITVTRQVVMGGKNKYLINGINVQNKRVNDLFCSVQLNVNNPHFLIMQGRITKVLNMKPPEILSMVEEAAGTRMYEAKKQAAEKTIEKKDAKLRELNDIIREDIAPKLQKLQDERAQFQEYQKVVRELENLTRLLVAYEYVTAEQKVKDVAAEVAAVEDDIRSKKETIESNKQQSKQLDQQVAELNKKLGEESGSVLKDLEASLQSAEKVEASAAAAAKAAREALASHDKRARLLNKALQDDEAARASKRMQLDKVSSEFESLRSASDASQAALAAAQQRFLAVSSGCEDSTTDLHQLLMTAKQQASEASTRISQSQMEKKHAEDRLKALQKEFNSSSSQFTKDQQQITSQQAVVDKLQAELSALHFDSGRLQATQQRARELQAAARRQRDAADGLAARLQRCDFRYSPPEPGFDERRVAGTICRLMDVKDPKYCTALETAAGGKLYHVVVDTEVTSKLLLERGRLQTRTTIIPLNKITPHVIPANVVKMAQNIGGGADKVQLALDLVTFDRKLEPAIAWVLGNTLVCSDLDTARKVTFDPRVKRRAVTLDGDVFDPAGTLSGGARQQGGSLLLQLQQLKEAEKKLQSTESELNQCQAELNSLQSAAEAYGTMQQKFEMMRHELEVVKSRLASTTHAQLYTEIENLKTQVSDLSAAVERDKAMQKETAARAQELEAKVKDIKGHREREFKKAEKDLKEAKKLAEHHSSSWKLREQEFEALRLEVEELEKAVENSSALIRESTKAAEELQEKLPQAKEEHRVALEAAKQIQDKIKKQKADISSKNTNIARLIATKEKLGKTSAELELNIKELGYKIKELNTEASSCEAKVKSILSEHGWVSSEKQYFGVSGGAYDFANNRAQNAGSRRRQLCERKDRLARGLNARAHALLAKEEEQYQEVMHKKKIVEADRAKLVQVMAELDDKKKQLLLQAARQVNKDFGSIFSALLPGAQAQLVPPPGLTVLDGLEVKVGFNNCWKESLGELSGGQRSLVALSLLLAMLRYKPAPLYILDEVDAALDLSHTQNIGHMLKQHFTQSQFIIVSLKDGMFNNANVLFRTKFVDGMSSVQRTANAKR